MLKCLNFYVVNVEMVEINHPIRIQLSFSSSSLRTNDLVYNIYELCVLDTCFFIIVTMRECIVLVIKEIQRL